MVVFYKILKKYNEIELTKNKMDLIIIIICGLVAHQLLHSCAEKDAKF